MDDMNEGQRWKVNLEGIEVKTYAILSFFITKTFWGAIEHAGS